MKPLFFISYSAIIVSTMLMVWRFVRAFESIAKTLEKYAETKQHLSS
jgi:hypothetical protein